MGRNWNWIIQEGNILMTTNLECIFDGTMLIYLGNENTIVFVDDENNISEIFEQIIAEDEGWA